VISDDPAAAITKELNRRPGAFLVMSTRGNGRLTGAVLGSVAGDILASTDAPFLALGPQADRPGWLTGRPRRRPAQFPDPLSVGAVVALVDGTASAEAALPVAASWAGALDRELVVVTVAEDAPAGVDGRTPNRFGTPDPAGYVTAVVEQLRATVPHVRGEVIRDPLGVASGVRSFLTEHPVAVIVVAATHRTGLERLRLGATAADIVRTATTPALIVPAARQQGPPPDRRAPEIQSIGRGPR
jgi:nucleotide-binding universal stress UspA family protein